MFPWQVKVSHHSLDHFTYQSIHHYHIFSWYHCYNLQRVLPFFVQKVPPTSRFLSAATRQSRPKRSIAGSADRGGLWRELRAGAAGEKCYPAPNHQAERMETGRTHPPVDSVQRISHGHGRLHGTVNAPGRTDPVHGRVRASFS